MKISTKTFLYIALIFLIGLATGGVLGVALTKRQMAKPAGLKSIAVMVKKELTSKLDLDAAQQKKIDPLVDRSVDRIQGIYFDTMKKIDHVLLEEQKNLIADLRPDQIAKLGTIAKSREEFIRKHNPVETQK